MTMTALAWPVARAGDALRALAASAELPLRDGELGEAPGERGALAAWLDEAARWAGVELEPVDAPYEALASALAACPPALVQVPTDDAGGGLLVVVGARRGRLQVLDPLGRRAELAAATLAATLAGPATEAVRGEVAATVLRAGLDGRPGAAATRGLIAARLRGRPIGGVWLLRRPLGAPLGDHARDRRFGVRALAVLAAYALAQLVWLASWWAIGQSALRGTHASGWLAAWALLLATATFARVWVAGAAGRLGVEGAALLSQRLLVGALRIDPDVLKREGIGSALGRVLESSALQSLAVGGGVQAALAIIELGFAVGVLALGAGGLLHAAMLVATLGWTAHATRGYLRARRAWTRRRLALTHGLTEAMIGYATRVAQADLATLADRDDRELVAYLEASKEVDRRQLRLSEVIPRAWPILAVVGLAPTVLQGMPSAGAIAAAIGGVLLAADSLGRLVAGAARLADAVNAWDAVSPLFTAGGLPVQAAPPSLALAPLSPAAPAVSVRGVTYRHRERGAPVLSDVELVIRRGERVLIDAPSGSGKSTLAALLAGLRRPDSGLVLAAGLDRASVGASGWRRRVAYAPQFHDNHIFSGTLAFNLLLGRGWPPTPEDLAAATALCHELGLGGLLERMPAGLFEQVGETGWQLSHGETSRVFLARALLQRAGVVILDESLAALDPDTLTLALRCVTARAETAIVIAHP